MSTIKVDTLQSTSGVVKPIPQVTGHINGISTTTIVGSVGMSSVTDGGSGITTASFTSAFANTGYTTTVGGGQGPANSGSGFRFCSLGAGSSYGGTVYSTTQVRCFIAYTSSNKIDGQYIMLTCTPT